MKVFFLFFKGSVELIKATHRRRISLSLYIFMVGQMRKAMGDGEGDGGRAEEEEN